MYNSNAFVNNITGDKMKKNKDNTSSVENYDVGNAEDCFELITKYGTYEIQPTADTENAFPKIAQGLPKKKQLNNQFVIWRNTQEAEGAPLLRE